MTPIPPIQIVDKGQSYRNSAGTLFKKHMEPA